MQTNRHFERRREWLAKGTPGELQLEGTARNYEIRYFADLTLRSDKVRRALFLDYDQKRETDDAPEVTIEDWIFRLGRYRKHEALCDARNKTIRIKSALDHTERRVVLLHEMIHAYEDQLVKLKGPHREWLLLDLYRRLSKRMNASKVRAYVDICSHDIFYVRDHGLLFLLKSLELDCRFKWKFGTVFGYGLVHHDV